MKRLAVVCLETFPWRGSAPSRMQQHLALLFVRIFWSLAFSCSVWCRLSQKPTKFVACRIEEESSSWKSNTSTPKRFRAWLATFPLPELLIFFSSPHHHPRPRLQFNFMFCCFHAMETLDTRVNDKEKETFCVLAPGLFRIFWSAAPFNKVARPRSELIFRSANNSACHQAHKHKRRSWRDVIMNLRYLWQGSGFAFILISFLASSFCAGSTL